MTPAECQRIVAKAQDDLKESQRAAAKEQDRQVVADGRKAKADLGELTGKVERSRADEARIQLDLARLNDAIREDQQFLQGAGDDFASPDEPARAEVQKNLASLLARRDRVMERLRDTRHSLAVWTLEAVKLNNTLTDLRQQHRNLQTIASGGELGVWYEGGVSRV